MPLETTQLYVCYYLYFMNKHFVPELEKDSDIYRVMHCMHLAVECLFLHEIICGWHYCKIEILPPCVYSHRSSQCVTAGDVVASNLPIFSFQVLELTCRSFNQIQDSMYHIPRGNTLLLQNIYPCVFKSAQYCNSPLLAIINKKVL